MDVRLPEMAEPVHVLVRATSALEDSEATKYALERAKAGGVEKPGPGDPIYDAGLWAYTVATAYIDADTPADGRAPFFDGGPQQVLSKLPIDTVAYLFQEQQHWQEEVSPGFKATSAGDLIAAIKRIAMEDGEVFFSLCSPYMQVTLARFMASLLANSRDTNLLSGAPSEASTTKSLSASARRNAPRPKRKHRNT